MKPEPEAPAQPFLRWPGGKRWLVRQGLPDGWLRPITGRYFEPFLGAGALFFHLAPRTATLTDANPALMNAYRAVRDCVDDVLASLSTMEVSKEAYDRVRHMPLDEGAAGAARFLYLNRLSFNGIFRVNRRGEFNVPFAGDRGLEYFFGGNRLRLASTALRNIDLDCCDFEEALNPMGRGDVAFCDPVYLSSTGEAFARYTNPPFVEKDLRRLMSAIEQCVSRGASVILSYPATDALDLGSHLVVKDYQRQSTIYSRARHATSRSERLILFADEY